MTKLPSLCPFPFHLLISFAQSLPKYAETEQNGEVTEIDCCYGNCVHQANCKIAKEVEEKFVGANYDTFKKEVADVVVDKIMKIQEKYNEIIECCALFSHYKK